MTTSLLGIKMDGRIDEIPPSTRTSRVVLVRNQNVLGPRNETDSLILKQMVDETLIRLTGEKSAKDGWLSLLKPEDRIGLVPTSHLNPTHEELITVIKTSLLEAGIPIDNILMAQGKPEKPKGCSALIALPALKAHWLTGIGTVFKNYITYSGNPSWYHENENVRLGEIWNLPFIKGKTKLVLVDALYPLCDKGPQPDPRYQWNYCGLIAGKDPVAVETICLRIITEKRRKLRGEPWPLSPPPLCVEAADRQYGLGTSKMDEIKLDHYGWEQDLLI